MEIIVDISMALASLEQIQAGRALAVQAGADAAYDFLRDYHSKMDWRGSRWMAGGDSGQFARDVVAGWQPPNVSGDTVTITNTFGLLSWKVTGGHIAPKEARALAIPLIPEAKGVAPRSFGQLFVAGRALCRQVGKELEAVYALSSGVDQAPWPGALPDVEAVADAFAGGAEPIAEKIAA
jgi:hypothetical protein